MYFAMRTGASQVATVQCIDAFQGKDNNLAPKGTFIHRLGKVEMEIARRTVVVMATNRF